MLCSAVVFESHSLPSRVWHCQGGDDDKRISSLVGRLGSTWGSYDADSTALVIMKDNKKFVVDGIDSAAAIQKVQKDFADDAIEQTIKSQEETFWQEDGHGGRLHAEPMLPGVRRVTAKNFQKLVIDTKGTTVFFQEFADWCPYCVYMHPWTNDLGWVISPLDNVFVGKMDSVANDTAPWDKYLQSAGIPNLFYLPADKKETPPAPGKKLGFGDRNEDREGPVPTRIEAMVRGIHKNMPDDGKKFDVEMYVKRGKLIVALEGFLSEAVDGDETKTWLDYLRGKVISDRGGYKEYAGLGARCKDTFKADGISTVSSEWRKALTAAALHTDPDDLGKDGTAVELVIAKLMQQLWSEMKSGGLSVDEADTVVKSAREFASKDMEECFKKESGDRRVEICIGRTHMIEIDTTKECFEASFEVCLRWALRREDKRSGANAWTPPNFRVRNGKSDLEQDDNNTKITYYKCKDTGFIFAQQRTRITGTMLEAMELRSFPFDVQPLTIRMSFEHSEEKWVLVPNDEVPAVQRDHGFTKLAEWSIPTDSSTLELFTENAGRYIPQKELAEVTQSSGTTNVMADDVRPAVIVRVCVKRNWLRYLWSIGYIMAALGISGTSAFLLDPQEDYADRLATIFTLLLASVAFQVVVDDKLPNMPYLSFLEIYIIIMNCGLLINAMEVVYSKSSGWEDDHFWIHYNLVVWMVVQVVFGLAAGIFVLPRQNNKLYELSPPEELSSDSSEAQQIKRKNQVEYKERDGFTAIYSSKHAKGKGQARDKKWATVKKHNKVRPEGVGPGAGTSVGLGVGDCDGVGPEEFTAKQSYHSGGVSWWKDGAGGGDSPDDPRAVEKELESIWPDIFNAMDANSDGEITADEITKATANVYEPIGLWLKSKGADGVDANSDGVISQDEWKEARLKMTKAFGAPSPKAIDKLREFVRSRQNQ
jgi:hypothetical protein